MTEMIEMDDQVKLIYTPDKRIPIGEPVIFPDGGHGIRLKKKQKNGQNVYETISLDKIHELVIQSEKESQSAGNHIA